MTWFVSHPENNRTVTTAHNTEHAAETEASRLAWKLPTGTAVVFWEGTVIEESA